MSKTLTFVIFFVVLSTVVSLVHYYLSIRLFRNTGLPQLWKNIGNIVLFSMLVVMLLAIVFSQFVPYHIYLPFLWVAYLWLGIIMLLFFSFLFIDIVKLVLFLYSKMNVPQGIAVDDSRRKFIINTLTLGASAGVLVASGVSVFKYLSKPVVKKIKVSLNGLPKVFDGYRIVQISDLHIGQLMTKATLQEVVNQVNTLNPDIIAITGDLVDGSLESLSKEITPIKDLIAKDGVFFVTGNHEYYNGVGEWVNEIKNLGVNVLSNESVKINNGSDNFYLAGIHDHDAERFGEEFAPNLKKALTGINEKENVVLLAHQPLAVKEAAEYKVDLVLSGHTHGGQIWPFNYLVSLQQRFLKGFYQYKGTKLYVNQGTGCWGPPMRLGTENEITEITLKA